MNPLPATTTRHAPKITRHPKSVPELVERAVVALSCDQASCQIERAAIVAYFQARCHTVVEIPADPHLAIGGVIELDALGEPTRDAFPRLSAAAAEQFTWDYPQTGRAS
jgi:mRNA-degrading endonuclease toxin of MazEF toxin-antitoxin module